MGQPVAPTSEIGFHSKLFFLKAMNDITLTSFFGSFSRFLNRFYLSLLRLAILKDSFLLLFGTVSRVLTTLMFNK